MKMVFDIFLSFLKVGAFSFGGGYAMISFIQKEMVSKNNWLSNQEFVDIIAISQMTPGPIAINTSTFTGYKIANIYGSIAGTLGVSIVSFTLMTLLASYLSKIKESKTIKDIFRGIRPAVLGLILSAALTVGKTAIIDYKSIIISVLILFSILKLKIHPILNIVLAGIIGYIVY